MPELFAVTAPGLAPIAAQELRRLDLLPAAAPPTSAGMRPQGGARNEEQGGVAFDSDLVAIYRANLHLRTASRVLVRLGEFEAIGFGELRKRAGILAWERFLRAGQPVALRVTCHKSRLYHSDAVAERVAGAIGDRLGALPVVRTFDEEGESDPPQLVVVRLLHDHCTISVDSSGVLLHRRGYRLATGKAPLRETLAAGILLASGWNPLASEAPPPLLDPFCGSGTIPIEAALLAHGIAPGRSRRFAFMEWPGYDGGQWAPMVAAADAASREHIARLGGRLRIKGSDRDAGAIEAAQGNAARAGVADAVEFSCRAVSAINPPPEPGWVVSNPPYGVRVAANRDLRNLCAQFGKVLRAQCPGWHVAVLGSDRQLLRQLEIPLESGLALVNGGIPVKLAVGVVAQADG